MRETFLASGPKLELVANVLAPGIGKSPAQNTDDNVYVFAMLGFAESAYHSGLKKAMNRYNRFFVTLVYQSHLEELLLSIAKA
jgi:hypothetical protein